MAEPDKRITLTMEQFDESLKSSKKDGANRIAAAVFLSSIPLAALGGIWLIDASPLNVLVICAAYFSGVAIYFANTT